MNNLFYCFLLLLALSACANRGSLQGGEKDETPPEILDLLPKNGSVNFNAEYIEFFFDENIRLNDLNSNLIVSPPFDQNPKTKVKPQSFRLYLPDSLLENTTYTLNFGDAIQDLNEQNPISGYTYVFSTGAAIDSLTYSGSTITAFENAVPENAWVLLHKNLSDTSVIKNKPYYLTKVEEDGTFNFNYLSAGTYNIFGLQDVNSNYLYDLPNEESFAYIDSTITIDDSSNSLNQPLNFFTQAAKRSFVKDLTNNKPGRIVLSVDGFKDSLNLEVLPEFSTGVEYTLNTSKDTLIYWLSGDYVEEDFAIQYTSNSVTDTVDVAYTKRPYTDSTFIISAPAQQYNHKRPLRLNTPFPINRFGTEEIALLEDSLYVAGGLTFSIDSLHPTRLIAENTFGFGRRYDVTLLPGSLYDVYGNTNDTLSFAFNTLGKERLAQLNVELTGFAGEQGQYIIQLLDREKVAYTKTILPAESERFTWANLVPANYTIRVIVDQNSNGEWDTGYYQEGLQPERVLNFPDPVELLANWEKDLVIDLSF